MKHILFIDCCVREEQSRTLALTKEWLENDKNKEDCEVDTLVLHQENLFPLTLRTLKAREVADKIQGTEVAYARQFARADEIVIAAPYWNMSFPSALKVYIDHVCVGGITFRYKIIRWWECVRRIDLFILLQRAVILANMILAAAT